MGGAFRLDEQLQRDCTVVGRADLCELLLLNNANHPWCILVPRRSEISEIYQLPEAEQQQLLRESSQLGRTMMRVFAGDKLNVAALGNVVSQLHIHHIVRYRHDAAWPAPVWGAVAARPYTADDLQATIGKLQSALAAPFRFT